MSYHTMVWMALGGNVLAWAVILVLLYFIEFEDIEGESNKDYEMKTAGEAVLEKMRGKEK